MHQAYVAFYEDAAKVEAAARAQGFTGEDGQSWHDFVESSLSKFRSAKAFSDLGSAETWLKAELADGRSVYGCGEIRLMKQMPRRCEYCTCGGRQAVYEYEVDDTGIVDGREVGECLDED